MSTIGQQIQMTGRRLFSIDLRALGMFRILLALAVLIDLAVRLPDLEVFYTDLGVFPVKAFHEYGALPWYWSIHALSGGLDWQILLAAITGASAIAMLVGWRTRAASFIVWVLLISVQNRNPLVLMGVDELLLVLLFFGMFLPWQKRYSMEARKHPEWFQQSHEYSFASVAIILQVVIIYVFTYLHKTGVEWTTDGTAIWYALQVDELVKPFGKWLLQFPQLLRGLTLMILKAELLIPIFLLLPVFTREARIVAIVMACCLHIGFALTLLVAYFPLVNIMAMVIFLPKGFWDWIDKAGLYRLHLPPSDFFIFPQKHPMLMQGLGRLRQRIPGIFIVYVLWFNITTLSGMQEAPERWQIPGAVTRLAQRWDMFAPYPMKDDGWFAMSGRLMNDSIVEVWRIGSDLKFHKPAMVIDDYPNFRWEKYMHRLWEVRNGWLRPYFATWRCRTWNATHSPQEYLQYFRMFFVQEFTMPPGTPPTRTINTLGRFSCMEGR